MSDSQSSGNGESCTQRPSGLEDDAAVCAQDLTHLAVAITARRVAVRVRRSSAVPERSLIVSAIYWHPRNERAYEPRVEKLWAARSVSSKRGKTQGRRA